MRNAWIALLLAGAGAAAMSGCGGGGKDETAAATTTPKSSTPAVTANASGVPATMPSAAEKEDFITVSGPLIVEHQVDVTAQRDGVISKIRAEAGARVKAGTLLAQLDDRQITANLNAGRAKSRSIENDLKNWQAEIGRASCRERV